MKKSVARARQGIDERPTVMLILGVGRTPFTFLPNSWGGDIVTKAGGQLLTAAIAGLSEADLQRIVDPQRNRTLRYSILHGLHDEAGHQGEIWLLRKLHGRQTAAATSTGS